MRLHGRIINVKKNGSCPVYVICYVDGERVRFKTGVEVNYNDFDNRAGAVRGNVKGAKDSNLLINNIKKNSYRN